MPYGTVKVDNITFTNGGSDTTITVSGLLASTSGNLTVTGTVSGAVANFISGNFSAQLSGATITGNTGQFSNITGVSGVFTSRISGVTITGTTVAATTGSFVSLTGTTTQGTTATFTTGSFTSLTGTTTTGTTANFASGVFTTQISGATITGTTVAATTGTFTTVTGGVATITSGVFALGSAAAPSISFSSDPNTGIYSPGGDQVALVTSGTGRLFIDSSGNVGIGASAPLDVLDVVSAGNVRARIRSTSGASFAGHLYQNSDTGTSTLNGLYAGIDGSEIGYLYHYGNNALVLGTNSLERLRITDNGRIGIGTSVPDAVFHTYANISGGSPATSGSSDPNIIARFQGLSVAFDIGGTAAGLQWIQPRLHNNYASNFGLALCPNGGNVLVGASSDSGGALLQINGDRIRVATAKTPSSATDTGTAGEICWDASYIYVCTAANTWKRAALSTW